LPAWPAWRGSTRVIAVSDAASSNRGARTAASTNGTPRRSIAYGGDSTFQNVVLNGLLSFPVDYAVDQRFPGDDFHGIAVRKPSALEQEARDGTRIVIFTLSSALFRQIRRELISSGFSADQLLYYGDLLFDGLQQRMQRFGVHLRRSHYAFAQAASLVFPIDNHSSSLGTAVLLGLLNASGSLHGAVAELGACKGGNALLVNLIATVEGHPRDYCIVDSVASVDEIAAVLSVFPHVHLHGGSLPAVLSELADREYCAVYYDGNVYQRAGESVEYFFPRLRRGGFLMIHDYLPKLGGLDAVTHAVDELLKDHRDVEPFEVPETAHLILRKL
jgi:hypothetical protein